MQMSYEDLGDENAGHEPDDLELYYRIPEHWEVIEHDGHTYRWQTNAGTLVIPDQQPSEHARDQNMVTMWRCLAHRGLGIIPERPPINPLGQVLKAGIAFYGRIELGKEISEMYRWMVDNFPARFSPSPSFRDRPPEASIPLSFEEVTELVDRGLIETGIVDRMRELDIND